MSHQLDGMDFTVEMETGPHFFELYDNQQFDYFVYDSQKLGQVRSFATSDYIQIMVINLESDLAKRADRGSSSF